MTDLPAEYVCGYCGEPTPKAKRSACCGDAMYPAHSAELRCEECGGPAVTWEDGVVMCDDCARLRAKKWQMDQRRTTYHRATLVNVLVYHQHTATSGCICGWAVLGASHPEHVADVYEQALQFDGPGGVE